MPGFVANGEHLEWIALYNVSGHGDLGAARGTLHGKGAFGLVTNRTLDKPFSPSSKALFHLKGSGSANIARKSEASDLARWWRTNTRGRGLGVIAG